ncbi:MAG: hypothetical protein Q9164_005912, partial [Protoblastenia rupestris]
MLPYSRLRAANVLSTLACIRLCVTGKPKRLAFVSSTSTLDNEYYVRLLQEIGTAVPETDDLEGSRKGLGIGYVNTIPVTQSLGVAQVTSHPRLTLNEWIGALETYGYRVPMVSYQERCTRVKEYVQDDSKEEEHALLPLFHFVMGDLPTNTIAPELDNANAAAALSLYDKKKMNRECFMAANAVGVRTLGMYLAYLVAVGFLPAPAEKGECKLPSLDGTMLEALAA